MRNIILKSHLALGDIVCLTAVPRELAKQYPGQFRVAINTPFPELWENNPHITLPDTQEEVNRFEMIEAHYDRHPVYSVNQSNENNVHLLTSYCQDVATSLGLPSLYPTSRYGDIHLSAAEYSTKSQPHALKNVQRYWIVVAGGKTDATVKWWLPEYFQRVIDYFRGRIQFVQVGAVGNEHWHPKLSGVIDLVGLTSTRELIRLIHSSCGVLCGITSAMHLAAAVPLPMWQKRPRPCVVVAGGREPRNWYEYPTHRVLDTVGTLRCCASGGCWNSHTVSLGFEKERLCERVVNDSPSCMNLITPDIVIAAINQYLDSEGIE